ncbi:MAG TPA: O-antigen ligase family protein [Mycobacteriales bacterium]|nr:O-antigen ligase family protein [Mycobacteriales bacterium]
MATSAPPHAPATGRQPDLLPVWPLWLLFAGFPAMWVLGLGGFATQIAAIPMAAYLAVRGQVRVPRGLGVWFLFLIWMAFTVVEITSGSRVVGFVYRATLYLAATVAFLFVYNSSRERLPLQRLCAMATCFLGFVIVGGYLGVIAPHHSLPTPLEHLVPHQIAANDLVGKMIHPPFAQVGQSATSAVQPRPSAPFPYTNDWGINVALLVPFAFSWMAATTRLAVRLGLVALLLLGLIPALVSLNRGMALGLGVGVVYVAVRLALRGHGKALVWICTVVGVAVLVASAFHFGTRLNDRLANSSTNQGRLSTYSATWDEALKSPVLGYGAPASSTVSVNGPDLGTQGQFWTVLYSSGLPGAGLFVLSMIGFAWITRRAQNPALMWLHAVPVVVIVLLPVYRVEATELVLLMVAVAMVLREREPRLVRRPARPADRIRRLSTAPT